ncbi:MAG: ATP-binding protein [Anaerolineae bacterium]|nr:AAA family ATPase [Anaerolineae bacterium]
MLIELKIKNYRSFREETTLSLVSSADKTLSENTMPVPEFGGRSLLRSAVVYGPNAAGKSNLIAAAHFVDDFVNSSMDRKLNSPIAATPFLLVAEPNTDPSEFEITFIDDQDVRYQYGFHVTAKQVVREWLVAYPKGLPQTWFEREQAGGSAPSWNFGRNLKGKNSQVAELTRPDVLFLSNAAKLNHHQLGRVFEWFQTSLRVIGADQLSPYLYTYSAARAREDRQTHERLRRLMIAADFGISDFEVHEETYTEKDLPEEMPVALRNQLINQKHLDVYMRHPVGAEAEVVMPLQEESNGTQRLFALGGPLVEVLEKGWTLFVDELDASLHPLLVRYLVEMFHNPQINPKGAQLIFNTHDTTLMDCNLFRRDQVWFVEKDRQGCSHLYPLLDYSPRRDEALTKGYLLGRYGAIPFLGEPLWEEAQHAQA